MTVRFTRAILRALRPRQWTKNTLVLVPLLAAHRAADVVSLVAGLLAALALCISASSAYIASDLLNLEADRAHWRKSKQPFAAGELLLLAGVALVPILLCAALLISLVLPKQFRLTLLTYYVLGVAYSVSLRKLAIADTVVMAGLYTLRIVAGAAAVEVPLSFWMLMFSVFLFLSLALVKRFAELDTLRREQRPEAAYHGYAVDDLATLRSLGTAAGYLSVLVLALYINSPEIQALYRRPMLIWALCVVMLYWISWVWMKVQRGEMHDDPVVFALKDRISLVVGLLVGVTVAAAI